MLECVGRLRLSGFIHAFALNTFINLPQSEDTAAYILLDLIGYRTSEYLRQNNGFRKTTSTRQVNRDKFVPGYGPSTKGKAWSSMEGQWTACASSKSSSDCIYWTNDVYLPCRLGKIAHFLVDQRIAYVCPITTFIGSSRFFLVHRIIWSSNIYEFLLQTIVATALPTIVAQLQGGKNYSWVGSLVILAFLATSLANLVYSHQNYLCLLEHIY